jgi:hypothetical protein
VPLASARCVLKENNIQKQGLPITCMLLVFVALVVGAIMLRIFFVSFPWHIWIVIVFVSYVLSYLIIIVLSLLKFGLSSLFSRDGPDKTP